MLKSNIETIYWGRNTKHLPKTPPPKRAGVSLFIKQKALPRLHVNFIKIHLCYQLKSHQPRRMHSSGIRNEFNCVSYRTDTLASINEKICLVSSV